MSELPVLHPEQTLVGTIVLSLARAVNPHRYGRVHADRSLRLRVSANAGTQRASDYLLSVFVIWSLR